MQKRDAIPALFMIAASGTVFFGTAGLNFWDGVTPGARFFPAGVAGVTLALALALLWTQLRGTDQGVVDVPDRPALLRVALTVVGLFVLAAGAPVIGLVPMLMVFCAFMLIVVLRQRPLPTLITTLVIGVGTHLVFMRWLAVPLPAPFGF
jgi:hypothetical protein